MENWRTYKKILLPDIPNLHDIKVYEDKADGYKTLKEVLTDSKWDRKAVVDEVKKANIRGRGGAGFNAGLKWSFKPTPKNPIKADASVVPLASISVIALSLFGIELI